MPQVSIRSARRSAPPPPASGCQRVAFVCNHCHTLALFRGGIIRMLVVAGYEVHAIAPYDESAAQLLALGADLHELPLSRHGYNPLDEWRTIRTLERLYRKLEPDIIFHYTIKLNIYGTYAAQALKLASVSVVPGLGIFPDVARRPLRLMLSRGYRYAAEHATEVWFLNQHDFGFFESRDWLRGTVARVLPGEGVDLSYFDLRPLPRRAGLKVYFIGRLLGNKGLRVFADAALEARDRGLPFEFHVIGPLEEQTASGVAASQVAEWVRAGILAYHGFSKDVRPFLEDADVVCVPTHYREGLNRTLQEAMACGRPVITTNVPGAGELVDHGKTGYIVPTHDPAAILDALELHYGLTSETKAAMGRRARQRVVRDFDERIVHGHYYDVIARVSNAATAAA